MMKKDKISWMPLAVLLLMLFAAPSMALDLGQAKSQGMVKETPSGYLAPVKSNDEVKALVNKINAARKAEYQKIANKRGVPLNAVEKQAGQKLTK